MKLVTAVAAVVLSCANLAPASAQEPARLVEAVRFFGNRRVPADTLRLWIATREGYPFSRDVVSRDLRTILAQGFFEDARVFEEDGARGGVEVTFEVEEYPLVLEVDFPGLSSVSQSDVLEEWRKRAVSVSKESQFDPLRARRAAAVVRDLLARKGRPYASVTPDAERVSPGTVLLHFRTDEGDRVRVAEIVFDGNAAFDDAELRSRMKLVREAGILAGLTSKDVYDKEKLAYDLDGVRRFYWSRGYLDVKIGESVVEPDGRVGSGVPLVGGADAGLKVTVPIEEGRVYRVGAVTVEGATVFPDAVVKTVAGAKPGEVVDLPKLQAALDGDLRRVYGDRGYAEAEAAVLPDLRPDPADPTAGVCDLTIRIDEGASFTVGRIEFFGNTFTRDKTIRREVPLTEGELYNRRLFELSILRLNQLGLFQPVRDTDADVRTNRKTRQVDVDYRVQEKGPQQIQFSGGGNGLGGPFVGLQYSTNNLLGYGESLAFDAQAGDRSKRFSFGFTEPYAFDRPVSAGLQLFYTDLDYVSGGGGDVLFTSRKVGGTVSVSTPLSTVFRRSAAARFARLGLSYSYQTTAIDDPAASLTTDPTGTLAISYAQAGLVQATLTPTFVYSTVDGGLDPTRGQQLSLGLGLSGGPAGGDVRLVQPFLEYRFFKPASLFSKRDDRPDVFAVRFLAGHLRTFGEPFDSGSLAFVGGAPFLSRYLLGGDDTIRGYEAAELGVAAPVERFLTQSGVTALGVDGRELDVARPRDANRRTVAPGTLRALSYDGRPLPLVDTRVGGDTEVLLNAEYRVPLGGPVSVAAFADVGSAWNLRTLDDQTAEQRGSALPLTGFRALGPRGRLALPGALGDATTPETPPGTPLPPGFRAVRFVGDQDVLTRYRLSWAADGFRENLRSTLGAELRVQVPVVNLPVRLILGYNPDEGRTVFRFAIGRTF